MATETTRKTTTSEHETLIRRIGAYRYAAHAEIFAHRHTYPFVQHHREMIRAWHGPAKQVALEAFRDSGKSTIGEEAIALMAVLQEFKNAIIVGSSQPRAAERLEAIKYEIETNEEINELFGDVRGNIWGAYKIVFKNGAAIQAIGLGQSMRGTKHHQYRPDFGWLDDIEDEESVRSADACQERLRWLYNVLKPAMAKNARLRMTGNRLDTNAVIAKVSDDPAWTALRFPVRYRGTDGQWTASWPEQFDLDWISESRAENERMGNLDGWEREYMCEAISSERRAFAPLLAGIVHNQVRTWQPVYAMFDPARTVNKKSATTGKAVWSFVGTKLVVWESDAQMLMPDAQIKDMFAVNERYFPVMMGVEEDGLNEFIMQPLRQEMLRRHTMLPIRAIKAPKDERKDDFILNALYHFFVSGQIEFAKDMPDLLQQFQNFPTGRKDAVNALAYAPGLRPGQPIYEDFTAQNVLDDLIIMPSTPVYLALNTDGKYTTAVLVQHQRDGLRILADWIEDGDPGQTIGYIVTEANLEAGRTVRCVGGPSHFAQYTNRGLVQAVARMPGDLRQGSPPERGRDELRRMLQHQTRGFPQIIVSTNARWTLNGFAGGFAREVSRGGIVEETPKEGQYRTLMEGLESFAGLLAFGLDDDREGLRTRTGRDGRAYVTTMPERD